MVCSIGNRGMAAMARLLAAAGVSQKIAEHLFPNLHSSPPSSLLAEDVAHWDIATNYIHRQLREADEANLLNEEDMHVFGLKPMADPLQLARCNACNKPVKSSRFAAHADLCKFLSASEGTVSELDGGICHKKPPRKKKKKSLTTTNHTTSVGDKQGLDNCNDTAAASEPHLHEQNRRTSSFSVNGKRNSPCVDGTLVIKGSGFNPEKTDQSTASMPPSTKRKMITAEGPQILDQSEAVIGATKSLCTSTQKQLTSREHPSGSSAGCETICDNVIGCQRPSQVHDRNLTCKSDATKYYVPAPMATKIYYSQSNERFRAALTYQYYQSSTRAHGIKPQVSQSSVNPSSSSLPKSPSNEQIDDQHEKRDKNSLPSIQKPAEIVDQSMEIDRLGGGQSAMNNPNQFSVNNVLGPDGLIESNHLPNNDHETFDGNSGNQLGKIQQPKGSVPVTDRSQV